MDEENKKEQKNEQITEQKNNETKLYAFVAIGLVAAGAVAFGLSFVVLGIYALIASMLFEIAAMTFINIQKKKNDLKWLTYIKIAAYAIFAAAIIVFAFGTVWSAQEQ